jgi:hypothetical protein
MQENDTYKTMDRGSPALPILCSGNAHQFCLTQPDLHKITVDTVSNHTVSDFLQLRF